MCFSKLFGKKDDLDFPDYSIRDSYINKYPRALINYGARPFITYQNGNKVTSTANMDIRDFLLINDWNIKSIVNKNALNQGTYDERALKCLQWVINNMKYISDETQDGYAEYWQMPFETLLTKAGDCECGAILLMNLMYHADIPYWRTRLTAGLVNDNKGNQGGHAYITYLCEETNITVLLDWCYYPDNTTFVKDRLSYKSNQIYLSPVWFSTDGFNSYGEQDKIDMGLKLL